MDDSRKWDQLSLTTDTAPHPGDSCHFRDSYDGENREKATLRGDNAALQKELNAFNLRLSNAFKFIFMVRRNPAIQLNITHNHTKYHAERNDIGNKIGTVICEIYQ